MSPTARVPRFRLPRTERSFRRSVVGSAMVHLGVVVVLMALAARGREPRAPGAGATGRAGAVDDPGPQVTFLTLAPAPSPSPAPRLPAPASIRPIEPPLERVLPRSEVLGSVGGRGPGIGPMLGGAGSGAGRGSGTSAEGGGDGVFPPQARYTVMPPMDRPPSVRGKSYRVSFRVDADGRVTRVEVEPEIPDAAYRKKFIELMYEYTFAPARRVDGQAVAGEAVLTITL